MGVDCNTRIPSIAKSPSLSRVCGVLKIFAQWWVNSNGRWSTRLQDSGVILCSKGFWLIALNTVISQKGFYLGSIAATQLTMSWLTKPWFFPDAA